MTSSVIKPMSLTVVTFNVGSGPGDSRGRFGDDKELSKADWNERQKQAASLLSGFAENNAPDVFCLQEAQYERCASSTTQPPEQRPFIQELQSQFDFYHLDTKRAVADTLVALRKNIFTDVQVLSTIKGYVNQGTTVSDSTVAVVKATHIASQQQFLFLSVQFAGFRIQDGIGHESGDDEAQIVAAFLRDFTESHPNCKVILGGDMNCLIENSSPSVLRINYLQDVAMSFLVPPGNTNVNQREPEGLKERKLDCIATKGLEGPISHEVVDFAERASSDHNPVKATFNIPVIKSTLMKTLSKIGEGVLAVGFFGGAITLAISGFAFSAVILTLVGILITIELTTEKISQLAFQAFSEA